VQNLCLDQSTVEEAVFHLLDASPSIFCRDVADNRRPLEERMERQPQRRHWTTLLELCSQINLREE
jgi:hypothetical protein